MDRVTAREGPATRPDAGPDGTTTFPASSVRDGWDDFTAGYTLGYESGYDVGFRHGEMEQAGAWATAMADVKELRRQATAPDRPERRVALTESWWATQAQRQYERPKAWENIWADATRRCPDDQRLWRSGAELRRAVERR